MLVTLGVTEVLLRHGPWLVFVFAFGACVGSFLNVVNWRMPRGMSLSQPPSRCPSCGGRLRFFRENLPILGWVLLRGKCRFCRSRISPIYPIVELAIALMFVGLYVVLFMTRPQDTWWWEVGGAWWNRQQFILAWPAWMALAFLFSGLFSMTVIDARTFLIPMPIPTFVTLSALALWGLESLMARPGGVGAATWPIPGTGWVGTGVAAGGGLGVLVAMSLLAAGRLRASFSDYDLYLAEGEVLADYPHARREMGVELCFLAPIVAGMLIGGWTLAGLEGVPPRWAQAIGGSLLGWLVGGGIVWTIRLLGTLAFGREAMGLGDVHLLAAVGAVLGWFEPILIFFLAPFLGLAWTALAMLAGKVRGRPWGELPYGPHLAIATVLLFLARPAVSEGWRKLMPAVEMPEAGLVVPVDNLQDWTDLGPAGPMHVERGDRAVN